MVDRLTEPGSTDACTLVATMAGGPQVVTFALDALLERGEAVHKVIVVHLSPQHNPLTARAIDRLAAEFPDHTYAGRACRLQFLAVQQGPHALDDICDEVDAEAAWSAVYTLIGELKAQAQRLHVCVAGGRRMLALQAISAAMLLFDHCDRLWHLYTPAPLLRRASNGAVMHARSQDRVRLIQVPLMPWGAYFPALRSLTRPTPGQALSVRGQMLDAGERARCQQVLARLTPRQAEVLRAFAAGGSPQDVAEELYISLKTVDTHKTAILAECRAAWGMPEGERLTYHFLKERFARFRAQEAPPV